jgi:hypothetical protein
MVTVTSFSPRKKSNGETVNTLSLLGDVEVLKSHSTGKPYLTAKRASIISSLDAETCKALIGTKLPGSIIRVPCEIYDFIVPSTGETIKLDYSYEYSPDSSTADEIIHQMESEA